MLSGEEGSALSGLRVQFLEQGEDLQLVLSYTPGPKQLGKGNATTEAKEDGEGHGGGGGAERERLRY